MIRNIDPPAKTENSEFTDSTNRVFIPAGGEADEEIPQISVDESSAVSNAVKEWHDGY